MTEHPGATLYKLLHRRLIDMHKLPGIPRRAVKGEAWKSAYAAT